MSNKTVQLAFPDDDVDNDPEDASLVNIPNDDIGGELSDMARNMGFIAQSLGKYAKILGNVQSDVAETKADVKSINERVRVIEEDEALREYQVDNIRRAVRIKISEMLGITWAKGGGVTDECIWVYKRYYGKFCQRLHNDAKHAHVEGRKYQYTPRKNYKKLIEFIHDWEPARGVEGLKDYIDKCIEVQS